MCAANSPRILQPGHPRRSLCGSTSIPDMKYLTILQNSLRRFACLILPVFLITVSVIVLVSQFSELSTKSEILSFTSFVVILSFSALAFNWCRVSAPFFTESMVKTIYQAGADLFLASLLALVASCFAWMKTTLAITSGGVYFLFFVTHWIFLCASILLFLTAILSLVFSINAQRSNA